MPISPATVPGIFQKGIHSARPAANDMVVGGMYSCSTHGIIYQSDGSAWSNWGVLGSSGTLVSVTFIIDGGGAVITSGVKGYIEMPFEGTITAARLLGDVSGSIVVDILKGPYSTLPPATSITASAKPTLSSAQKSQDTTLTGWTTHIDAGEWLGFQVTGTPATVTRVTVSLTVVRA